MRWACAETFAWIAPSATSLTMAPAVPRPAGRVDRVGEPRLLDEELHRAQRNALRVLARDGVSLGVAAQRHRLRAGERRDQPVIGAAHDVHLGLLVGEPAPAAARDHAHPRRLRLGRAEVLLDDLRPQAARGAELAHLLEQVAETVGIERPPAPEPAEVRA